MIDFSAINVFEYTAMKQFHEYDGKLNSIGVELWVADLNREALELVSRSPFGQGLYPDRMHFNLEQAVEAYQQASNN